MVSFGHCIICPSIYGFWLPLWYLLAIVLSVLQFTVSGYPYGIFWPLYCLSFNIRFLVTPMVSFGHCIICPSIYGFWLPLWYLLAIVLSVLQFTVSGYPYGIFWPLYYLSFNIRFLVTPMVSFGHCIISPSIYGFWYPLWYFQTFLNETPRGRRGRDRMVVGFTIIYAIGAYHNWCCGFYSRSWWGVQHYVIKFVSDIRQLGRWFSPGPRFPPPIKLTATI
jgi:hypothetical protein